MMLIGMAQTALGGYLSDTVGWLPVMRVTLVASTLVCFPCFILVQAYKTWWALVLLQLVLGSLQNVLAGTSQLFMHNIFDDVVVRYTVMGVSYNLALTVFGGTAPMIAEALVVGGSLLFVALYVFVLLAMALVIMFFVWTRPKYVQLKEESDDELEVELQDESKIGHKDEVVT